MRSVFYSLLLFHVLETTLSDLYRILEVLPDASDSEIKKSYRRLALELHPDKIPSNCSEAEKEVLTLKFIEVQNAYETLGDAESRLRYDLSTQGIEYSTREARDKDRYTSGPFIMYTRSKNVKVLFQANFKKKPIPEIGINVAVSARDVFSIVNGNVSFYRSVKCRHCGGNGGMNGSCATCQFCNGYGSANHLFHDEAHRFEQMTKTECGICGGRGCVHDHGQCSSCKGSGFVMELTSIAYNLPVGFADGSDISFARLGHEDLDGDTGSVKLRFMISFPPLWSRESTTSPNLEYTMNVPFKIMEGGLKRNIISVSGETLHVEHNKVDLITAVTGGVSDVVFPERGLYGPDGLSRGTLTVKIVVSYEDLSTEDILSAFNADDIHGGEGGLFGKLLDILNPPCDAKDNDGLGEGQAGCQPKAKGSASAQEKSNFATSAEDVSLV